eukprot:COSAG01_NODE_144_length_24108_cov_11.490441_10_plen_62_part_00
MGWAPVFAEQTGSFTISNLGMFGIKVRHAMPVHSCARILYSQVLGISLSMRLCTARSISAL